MLDQYAPIGVMLVLTTVLCFVIVFLSRLLGPRRPTQRKLEPYESGMTPIGPAMRRLPVKFYLVAVLFVVHDGHGTFRVPLAYTVALALLSSLLLSIFIIPTVCLVALKSGHRESPVFTLATRLYLPLLGFALRRRAIVLGSAGAVVPRVWSPQWPCFLIADLHTLTVVPVAIRALLQKQPLAHAGVEIFHRYELLTRDGI